MTSLSFVYRNRGFTLVEIILVILVITILASTLLPKLMGAPARARDAGRINELSSLELALQSYYNDHGSFPASSGGTCLNPSSGVGGALISNGYFLTSNFPKDPSQQNTTGGKCTSSSAGLYYYKSLTHNGISNNAFVLVAGVENPQKANASTTCVWASNTVSAIDTCLQSGAGNATGAQAIFAKLGGI